MTGPSVLLRKLLLPSHVERFLLPKVIGSGAVMDPPNLETFPSGYTVLKSYFVCLLKIHDSSPFFAIF